MDSHDGPGPNPDSLEAVDEHTVGNVPVSGVLCVTYTSNSLSDYARVHHSERGISLALAEPLHSAVRTTENLAELKAELNRALGAIGVSEIVSHFVSQVSEYVQSVLPTYPLPSAVGLGVVIYLLQKLRESDLLGIGRIHQASIDEFPNWMRLIENAKKHDDISVN